MRSNNHLKLVVDNEQRPEGSEVVPCSECGSHRFILEDGGVVICAACGIENTLVAWRERNPIV